MKQNFHLTMKDPPDRLTDQQWPPEKERERPIYEMPKGVPETGRNSLLQS